MEDPAFALGVEQPNPNAYIQWKGTDVCMDFTCECGSYQHLDGMFFYSVTCDECGAEWEMPTHIYPRRKQPQTTSTLSSNTRGTDQ